MSDFIPFSEAGADRREQILAAALRRAAAVRRRRAAARALGVAAPLIIVVALWASLGQPDGRRTPIVSIPTTVATQIKNPTPNPRPAVTVHHIETDLTLVDRLSTRPTKNFVTRLGDDQFLSRLAEAGRPAGLVNVNGRSVLVFHDATDSKDRGL